MIDKTAIKEAFDNIKKKGKWDTENELLYGYYFLDRSLDKLNSLGNEMTLFGYTLVDIFQADSNEKEESKMYYLHIEKVEIHSVNSLHERNMEFYEIAQNYGLHSYDGFDIGEV